jgi:VWFA-related protein
MRNPVLLSRREILMGTVSIILGDLLARSQESQPANTKISVDVDVVNVFVTVRDKKRSIVRNLTREDFSLSEDGRPQAIQYFSQESDLPLTIGLIVDTTPSESNMLETEREASRVFLNKMLRPDKDSAFLIQYYSEVELLQDVTSSREKLESALRRLRSHELSGGGRSGNGGGRSGGPGGSRRPGGSREPGGPGGGAYSTVLADAVYLASDEIMKTQKGRKALIILGDGDHIGDREEMAIEAAQQADTLIYTIRIYDREFGGNGGGWRNIIQMPPMGGPGGGGPGGGGPGGQGPGGGRSPSDGKENLQNLSRKAGGAYFEVSKKETLEQIYGRIEEELRSQYSLGYTPDPGARPGYRRIRVSLRKKDMTAFCREGYYPRIRS